MKTKIKKPLEHKRHGKHHNHSKQYKQIYWPFMPLLVSLLIFGLVGFSFFRIEPTTGVLAYATEMSQGSLLDSTNSERNQNGKAALKINSQLTAAAQAKANDMVVRNYWSHNTPDGQEPWVFVNQAGYKYTKAGENLAYGFSSSSSTVTGWMNSASHKANMLDSSFTEVGFGYANSGDFHSSGEQTVVVAMYGQPQTLAVTNQSTPTTPAAKPTAKPATAPTPAPEPAPAPIAEEKPDEDEGKPIPVAATDTGITEETTPVTKAQVITNGQLTWAPVFMGLLSGSAITGLFANHALRLRRFFAQAEHYFVAHPLFDVNLIGIALFCVEMSRTEGFIR